MWRHPSARMPSLGAWGRLNLLSFFVFDGNTVFSRFLRQYRNRLKAWWIFIIMKQIHDRHWRIHIWTSSLGTPILDQLQSTAPEIGVWVRPKDGCHTFTDLALDELLLKRQKTLPDLTFGHSKASEETILLEWHGFLMHICCPMPLPDGPSVEDTPSMEVPQLQGSQRVFDRISD